MASKFAGGIAFLNDKFAGNNIEIYYEEIATFINLFLRCILSVVDSSEENATVFTVYRHAAAPRAICIYLEMLSRENSIHLVRSCFI